MQRWWGKMQPNGIVYVFMFACPPSCLSIISGRPKTDRVIASDNYDENGDQKHQQRCSKLSFLLG